MKSDKANAGPADGPGDFQFDAAVAAVFDDMLARSVPCYAQQQQLIGELAAKFHVPNTGLYDLGCSTGTTLLGLAQAVGADGRLVGYDNSQAMLDKAAANIAQAHPTAPIELRCGDLNGELGRLELSDASVVTLCWTLQFVRPLKRDALIGWIHDGLVDGGALIVTEKVLTNDSHMNRFFIDLYYDFKRRNGYSEEEIGKKREALENVLIPYRVDENVELFRRNGFNIVETFFQWYNFAGFICVKAG